MLYFLCIGDVQFLLLFPFYHSGEWAYRILFFLPGRLIYYAVSVNKLSTLSIFFSSPFLPDRMDKYFFFHYYFFFKNFLYERNANFFYKGFRLVSIYHFFHIYFLKLSHTPRSLLLSGQIDFYFIFIFYYI